MTAMRRPYVPSMSDTAVKAKTEKNWAGWFGALDTAGAARLDHQAIARVLSEKHGLSGWWCQMVTVEYERARGLRVRHETASGFSVASSKTIATTLSHLYAATANPAKRKKWFPKGALGLSSQTKNKYFEVPGTRPRGSRSASTRRAITRRRSRYRLPSSRKALTSSGAQDLESRAPEIAGDARELTIVKSAIT